MTNAAEIYSRLSFEQRAAKAARFIATAKAKTGRALDENDFRFVRDFLGLEPWRIAGIQVAALRLHYPASVTHHSAPARITTHTRIVCRNTRWA